MYGASFYRGYIAMGAHKAVVVSSGASLLCALLLLGTAWAHADQPPPQNFDIGPQVLATALTEFARQSHEEILYSPDVVASKLSSGVRGTMPTRTALQVLLKDSGLTFSATPKGALLVGGPSSAVPANDPSVGAGQESPKEGKQEPSSSFRVAQVDQGQNSTSAPVGNSLPSAREQSVNVEEIVVTAEKREERLQEVPVAITVLNAETLAENNQSRIQDYFATVPGLGLDGSAQGGGTQYLTIRGLSTGDYANPTVAFLIDDVPFGSSALLGLGYASYPDIDPGDLARIEVLKGPQGTLYGASAMGGLIKVVTKDPSTTAFSGQVQVQGQDIPNGGVGYGVRGSVNIPLSDTLAIRVSGFGRRDPGYIDNVTTGQNDLNSVNVFGGRIAALWRPLDHLSLKVTSLLQSTDGNGDSYINVDQNLQPVLGDRRQTGIRGATEYHSETRFYAATFKYAGSGFELVSVSGYGINKLNNGFDYTNFFTDYARTFGTTGSVEREKYENKKFSQEVRISASLSSWLDWLGGAFYTHETNPLSSQIFYATDPVTGSNVSSIEDDNYSPASLTENAVFGDVTTHVTQRVDVQIGGRESWNRQLSNLTSVGLTTPIFFAGPSPFVRPEIRSSGDAFTYLVTPRFKITPDLMVYARVASGYRVGGPNINTAGVPESYSPDKTVDYELGIKANLLNHALALDSSVYYIDWKRIQLGLFNTDTGASYTANGGTAKSEGLELSVQARPVEGTALSAQLSLNKAVLTEDLPANASAFGLSGDRLPYSARVTGGLTIDQDIIHFGTATGFVGGSVNYVGAREGEFQYGATAPRLRFPAYTTASLRAGVRSEPWDVNLYVNNVGDKRGIIGEFFGASVGSLGYSATIIQPRTVGLSASRKF
jgi:iron complex outermembrane recepter protein